MPTPKQERQTKSLNVGNKDQVRFNEPKSRSLQTGHLEHFRFHEQGEGISQDVIQDRLRYNVPPPNISRNMVISEMNRMGINKKVTTEPEQEQEARRALEEMRKTFLENERTIREEVEAKYKAQILNLTRINEEQKEANKQNNATSLFKINLQENTILTLEKEKRYLMDKLEEATKAINKNRTEIGTKHMEIKNLKEKEENYIGKIQELHRKIQNKEDIEQHLREETDEFRTIITDLTSSNHSQSYNEVRLSEDLVKARATIEQLKNTSTNNQQAKDKEIMEQPKNNSDLSLLWDNSADLGLQTEVTNTQLSQKDPIGTNEKECTSIYENQFQISKTVDQDNSKNEIIENINRAKAANQAEMNMTLRNQEKLNPPAYLKDYITE